MSGTVIIPARYGSSRFPGKPLRMLGGIPIIRRVYENSLGSAFAGDRVVVATDSREIFDCVTAFGGRALMTSGEHRSGTDRCAEAARSLDCDIIVNVQGDEPFIRPEIIDSAAGLLIESADADMGTLATRLPRDRGADDPNVVKVVFDLNGYALYFSRSAVPYPRDGGDPGEGFFHKHIGIYAYRRDSLFRLTALSPSRLERVEALEQLRALENGMRIKVKEIEHDTIGIDTPGDIERAERWLSTSS